MLCFLCNILLRQVNIAMDSFKSIPVSRAAQLTYTAAGAVLIAVCSWISVPAAVPFTLQTFAVFFVLSLLGGKMGNAFHPGLHSSGRRGNSVFSNFQAGIGVLLGSTGGYIAGFLFLGLIYRAFYKIRPGPACGSVRFPWSWDWPRCTPSAPSGLPWCISAPMAPSAFPPCLAGAFCPL